MQLALPPLKAHCLSQERLRRSTISAVDCPECGAFNSSLASECDACGIQLTRNRRDEQTGPRATRAGAGEAQRVEVSSAKRLAAWLLFAQGAVSLAWVVVTGDGGPFKGSTAYVVSAVIDGAIGIAILHGSSRVISLAIAREAFGALLLGTAALIAGSLDGLGTIAAGAAIVFLLLGDPGPDRRRLAAAVTAVAFLVSLMGAYRHRTTKSEQKAAATEEAKGGPVVGESLPYSFVLPPGWVPSAEKGEADKSFTKRSAEAVIRCSVSKVELRSPSIDSVVAELVRERTLVEERSVPALGDRARMLRLRWLDDGKSTDAWVGIFLTADYTVQLSGAAPSSVFHDVGDEIARAVQSLTLPPGLRDLPKTAGAAIGSEFVGPKNLYTLKFPAGWHVREYDDDAGAFFDLRAFRPYRDANVAVESIPAATPFNWSSVEEGLLTVLRGSNQLEVLSHDKGNPASRTIRARLEVGAEKIDVVVALHRLGNQVVMVRAFAPTVAFAALEGELTGIVSSFSASTRR